jgi:hypothetical protein
VRRSLERLRVLGATDDELCALWNRFVEANPAQDGEDPASYKAAMKFYQREFEKLVRS